ncbi:Cna B-type domain-containing protein [Weissella diestrammenae]|uniref:Cna B-type domain-containing protein n=1 Tax=Weissella diestrammenae TaxID=1162633 RepID=A0A7G9T558_9LACO|nr:Cna B-type domain-containing protein [Weissella diestrammenae]MCM0583089.1 Cna B-type domain-containing protein [Weissella diestrammenae]QNN75233.1 Cna B-type domain-containing protein [Weissella diestrammenae]
MKFNYKLSICLAFFVVLSSFLVAPMNIVANSGKSGQVQQQTKLTTNTAGLTDYLAQTESLTSTGAQSAVDVSDRISDISLTQSLVSDGQKTTVRVRFSDRIGKINGHDTMTISWPNVGNIYGQGYLKTMDLTVDGRILGQVNVTDNQATVTFNDEINGLDNVTGWIEFDIRGRNVTNTCDKNTGIFTIKGGNQVSQVTVDKPASGTSGPFYFKSGDMQPDDTKHVRWFLNVNNQKHYVSDQVYLVDQIQPGQTLKKDSFDIQITGARTAHFVGKDALTKFRTAYPGAGISIDEQAQKIVVVLPASLVMCSTFNIMYLTDIDYFDQPEFKNNSQIWYREYNQPAVSGRESNCIVKNANVDGDIEGKKRIAINGVKSWADNDNAVGLRPENVTFNLYQDNRQIATTTTSQSENWQYHFNNLKKYNDNNIEYHYTVVEEPVEHYRSVKNGNDFQNILMGQTSISGTKTWRDNDDENGLRPQSVLIDLYRNGKKVDTKSIGQIDNWQYRFNNLDQYDMNGHIYQYRVQEEPVPHYRTTQLGNDFINTLMIDSLREKDVDPIQPEASCDSTTGISPLINDLQQTNYQGNELPRTGIQSGRFMSIVLLGSCIIYGMLIMKQRR